MQKNKNILGIIVKTARKNKEYTREQLAEKFDISSRYLTSIENEDRKPSYNLLHKIIRELGIPADSIFYPEMKINLSKKEQLIHMINQCDEHNIDVLLSTVAALLKRNDE